MVVKECDADLDRLYASVKVAGIFSFRRFEILPLACHEVYYSMSWCHEVYYIINGTGKLDSRILLIQL
jgi:hypothetical protein